jgi:hypothetical protein
MAFDDQSDSSEIDIPCSKKPLIKKLMMFIKNEQKNLHEGIALQGLYEGKVVKLNTIFEGEHRRFKTFVKTNENKIVKVHFGPTSNENCLSEGITRRGSQTREPIEDTDYEVVSKTEDEVILKDKETGKKEVWVEKDDFAGYVIEIGGRGYEFTHGVNEDVLSQDKEFKVGDIVANSESRWIGIVRSEPDRGELRTDADGMVDIRSLEIYDANNKTHASYHIAPSTKKEMGLNEDSYKKYVVEPRHDDGSLNVKRDYNPNEPKSFITGATEDELFDYFFTNNKDNPKFQHSAGWKDIVEWYKEQGLTIREKTW